MDNADLYKGFTPEKQAEYEAWLMQRADKGIDERIRIAVEERVRGVKDKMHETMKQVFERQREAEAGRSEEEKAARMVELKSIEDALAEGLRGGIPPTAEEIAPLIVRHKAFVSAKAGRPCTEKTYRALADIYLEYPEFVKRHEAIEPGFSDYLITAMKAHAARE